MSNEEQLIFETIVNDRNLLHNAVVNLLDELKHILTPVEMAQISSKTEIKSFWWKENLKIFFEYYLNVWNDRRLAVLN